MLNLIDSGFQNSNLFMSMPLFDEINYLGQRDGKVRKYRAVREDQECDILSLDFIRKEEDILWKAAEDFLKRSTINACQSVHGVFSFDLLTIDIHKEANTFNHNELSALIANTARKLKDGEVCLIKYSSSFGLIQKMVHEDWGKIIFKSSVEVFKDKPLYIDIMIKALLKDFQFPNNPVILLLNDLSSNPVYDPRDMEQQERLKVVMKKVSEDTMEFLPEVYIQDKRGVIELLSKFF